MPSKHLSCPSVPVSSSFPGPLFPAPRSGPGIEVFPVFRRNRQTACTRVKPVLILQLFKLVDRRVKFRSKKWQGRKSNAASFKSGDGRTSKSSTSPVFTLSTTSCPPSVVPTLSATANSSPATTGLTGFTLPSSSDPTVVFGSTKKNDDNLKKQNFTSYKKTSVKYQSLITKDESPEPSSPQLDIIRILNKCSQIQGALLRLLVIKVDKLLGEDAEKNDELTGAQALQTERIHIVEDELRVPLEGLSKCMEHQVTFQNHLAFLALQHENRLEAKQSQEDSGLSSDSDKEQVEPRYDENEQLKTLFDSSCENLLKTYLLHLRYTRNPFSKYPTLASCENVVHGLSETGQLNIPHGFGTLKTSTGDVIYEGTWEKGKRHGYGKALIVMPPSDDKRLMTSDIIGYYSGEWRNNYRHGQGKMMFSTRAVYDGEWKFDRISGEGCFELPGGCTIQGNWVDGVPHGYCLFVEPNGMEEFRMYEMGKCVDVYSKVRLKTEDDLLLSRVQYLKQQTQIRNLGRRLADKEARLTRKTEEARSVSELNTLLNKKVKDLKTAKSSLKKQI